MIICLVIKNQSNRLQGWIQQDLAISDEEVELARECYKYIRDEMRQLTGITIASDLKNESNSIWIPYSGYLTEALPAEKGINVRMTKRFFCFSKRSNVSKISK
jgi:hypothetical protein